jgi:hypothetical protein
MRTIFINSRLNLISYNEKPFNKTLHPKLLLLLLLLLLIINNNNNNNNNDKRILN